MEDEKILDLYFARNQRAITDFIWHDYLMRKLEERRQKRTAKAEAARAKQADAKQN